MNLNELQLEKIADILINMGIVFLATNVLPIINNNQTIDMLTFAMSAIVIIGLWIVAILLLSYTNNIRR